MDSLGIKSDFTSHLLDEVKPVLLQSLDDNKEAFGERFTAVLDGIEEKSTPIGPPPTPRVRFLEVLLHEIGEVEGAIRAMRMASAFSRQFPARKTYEKKGITETEYLKYHLEHYSQEIYRLREALTRLIRAIEKEASANSVKKRCKFLKKAVLDGFDKQAKARGILVHVERYRDTELDRMDTLRLFSKNFKDPEMLGLKVVHDAAYRSKRLKVSSDIAKSVDNIEEEVKKIYVELDLLVFPKKAQA